jgi:hypothetical protein
MLGRIMGVVSDQDGEQIVGKMVQQGSVEPLRARDLERSLRLGRAFTDVLSAELAADELAAVVQERMVENLRQFLELSGPAWFEPMNQLFFAGLRVEHSTTEILAAAQAPSPVLVEDGSETILEDAAERVSSTRDVNQPPPTRDVGLNAFADHDRDRSGGHGAFTVEKEHLDIVDLRPSSRREPSVKEVRFASSSISSEQVEAKLAVANRVLQEVVEALSDVGVRALPRIQGLLNEEVYGLDSMRLDSRGGISIESVQHSLALRSPTEHRSLLEKSLVMLTEGALNIGADHLDDDRMERLLERTAGFHQRLRE